EKVAVNYGKSDQEWLSQMTVDEAAAYCTQGQFAPGSMLPKVMACMKFAESKKGRIALITSLDKALEALNGSTGTRIVLE
ncbi:MAG: carbamate kinase, partial [Spirochaetales bacterium]|nr:carbamate kinase [Spirochaetales bacterium]